MCQVFCSFFLLHCWRNAKCFSRFLVTYFVSDIKIKKKLHLEKDSDEKYNVVENYCVVITWHSYTTINFWFTKFQQSVCSFSSLLVLNEQFLNILNVESHKNGSQTTFISVMIHLFSNFAMKLHECLLAFFTPIEIVHTDGENYNTIVLLNRFT